MSYEPTSDHPSRKRSVFARGAMGGRKRLPPSNQRKLSMFRSPSFPSGSKNKTPVTKCQNQSKPLFSETLSMTSTETRDSEPTISVVTPPSSTTMDLSPMQSEVTVLRQKLQDLGSTNKRSELLLGQVKVLEEESQRKDEKLRVLNDKLHDIQRGLSHIDDERESLQGHVKQLEEEKRKIQRQLDLREAEVLTLVKRCAAQEDKVKESTLLRCKNAELEQEVGELRSALAKRESDQTSLDSTMQELQACQQRLQHTKRDHDSLANTLQNCLANIKKLTHEKQEWEDERRRLLKRAEAEIEKERLQHLAEMNEIKVCLQSRQDKIDKLEEFMKDKSMTNLMLRKTNAELNKWKAQTSVKLEDCERQIVELTDENKAKENEILKMSSNSGSWASKIQEKEEIISSLEREVSQFMTKAMSISETVEVLQDENEELEELVEELQEKVKSYDTWEEERDAMLQYLAVTQNQIQELMEEVVTLQLEKDELEDQRLELQQDDIQDLEQHMSDKESNWKLLEENLRVKIASLEAEKLVMQEGFDTKLKESQDTIRALEWTVASRTKDAVSLQKDLEEAREAEADNLNQIKSLECNLSDATTQSQQSKAEADGLRNKTLDMKTEMNANQEKLKESYGRIEKLESALKNKEIELGDTRLRLESTQTKLSDVESQHEKNNAELGALKEKGVGHACKVSKTEKELEDSNRMIDQLESQHEAMNKALSEAIKVKAELELDLQATIKKLETSTANEDSLRSEIDAAQKELGESNTLILDLQSKLANKEEELEECSANENGLKSAFDAAQREIDDCKTLILDLETKLIKKEDKALKAHSSEFQDVKEEMQNLKTENSSLQTRLAKSQATTKELEEKLATKETELSGTRAAILRHQEENSAKRAELQRMHTELVLKDDELRDLRLIELKDFEEEVSSLREQLAGKESEISALVGKLENLSVSQLERELEVSEEVNNFKATISSLKREYEQKEAGWLSAGEDVLQDLKSSTVALQRRNQLLEKRVECLQTEKDLILASESSAVSEKTKLEAALARELGLKEGKAKEVHECQVRIAALEASVSTMSAQNVELERLLKERTRLLGEMVEVNKNLQNSIDGFSQASYDTQKVKEERDALVEALSREQNIREVLEAEASTVHAQLASMKKQVKDTESLRTENSELVNKIKRQEAFLKKKIQKEKVLRDRNSSRNITKTPAQLGSTRQARSTMTTQASGDCSFIGSMDPNSSVISEDDSCV